MENSEKKIHNFLTRHDMSAEQVDLNQCLADYIDEMEAGLDGRESSLLMLPSYILLKKINGKARRIVAVDAGGTNLRVGLVSSDENGHCRVEQINKYRMPGAQRPITSDEFFAALAEYIGVFTPETKTIAISFAYPAQIMPDLDGRIIGMVKEVQISGIEGCLLGRRLAASLAEAGHSECRVYVTNDTVAACLAGMSESKGLDFSSYVGLILGTGTNTCYAEDPAYIKNVPIRPGALPMIINTESGNYNRMPRGDFDRLFDQTTMDPGRHMLEKMTSGGYLGALTDYIIRMSEAENLFSPGFYREYGQCERLDTADLGADLENRSVLPFVKEQPDREMLAYLFANMIERAAKLAALQAAGAAVKSGCGRDRRKPVCIMAEGSTFYKLKGLEGAFNATMKSGLQDEYGIYTHVMTMEDAVIKGAAIAGLLQ